MAPRNYGPISGAGAAILADAVWWLDAANYSGSGNWLNTGTGGSALDAVPGAAGAAPTFMAGSPSYWAFDGGDHFDIADHASFDFAAGESFTIMVIGEVTSIGTSQTFVAKRTSAATATANTGWVLHYITASGPRFNIDDGAIGVADAGANLVAATETAMFGVRDVAADTVQSIVGLVSGTATTDTTTATLENANAVRIGRLSGAGTTRLTGGIRVIALWRRALNSGQRQAVAAYYGR